MLYKLCRIDSPILVAVHGLNDLLAVILDNTVKHIFGSRDDSILMFVRRIYNSCSRLRSHITPSDNRRSLGVFSVTVRVCAVKVICIAVE